jgi:hypothetical protein
MREIISTRFLAFAVKIMSLEKGLCKSYSGRHIYAQSVKWKIDDVKWKMFHVISAAYIFHNTFPIINYTLVFQPLKLYLQLLRSKFDANSTSTDTTFGQVQSL